VGDLIRDPVYFPVLDNIPLYRQCYKKLRTTLWFICSKSNRWRCCMQNAVCGCAM